MVFGLGSNPHAADVNYLVLPAVVIDDEPGDGRARDAAGFVAAPAAPAPGLCGRHHRDRWPGIATFTILAAVQTQSVRVVPHRCGRAMRHHMGGHRSDRVAGPCGGNGHGGGRLHVCGCARSGGARPLVAVLPTDAFFRPIRAISVGIYANGMPFQTMWPAADTQKPEIYQHVYDMFPGRTWKHALIIGAGSGTDTAMALSRGVEHIDAVEIDPAIVQIGAGAPPRRAVCGPASHGARRRRAELSGAGPEHVRPRHLRPARFAHAPQLGRKSAPRVVPVHGPGLRGRRAACCTGRRPRHVQLVSRAMACGPHRRRRRQGVWKQASRSKRSPTPSP